MIYCPDRGIKIVESNHVRFLESDIDDYKWSYIGDMIVKKKISYYFYLNYLRKYHISSWKNNGRATLDIWIDYSTSIDN